MKRISRKKNFLKGVGTGGLFVFFSVAIGFFLAPFLLRYLSREEYGLFVLTHELLMWLGLVDIGISGALTTLASQLSGRPDQQRLNVLASTAFFAQLAEAALVLLLGTLCVLFFDRFFEISPELRTDAVILVGLLVLRSFVLLVTKVFASLLVAHQQVHVDNLIKIALLLIRTGLVVILVMNGFGVVSLGIGALVAAMIVAPISVWRTYRLLPQLKLGFRSISWSSLKSVLGLGIWFSLKSLAHLGITSSSNILTGKLVSVAMITSLSLTGRLCLITRRLLLQISRTLRPALGQMIGEGKRDRSFSVFRYNLILSSGFAAVIVACILSVNRDFVAWWVGDVHYAGGLVDVLLCIQTLVFFWNTQFMVILTSDKQMKGQTVVRIAQFLVGIGVAIYFGRIYGLAGIIGGMVVAALITSFWYLPMAVCRRFGRNFLDFLVNDLSRIIIFSAMVVVFAWYMRGSEAIGDSLGAVLLRGMITGMAGMLLGWFILLDHRLRKMVLQKAGSMFARLLHKS